MSRFSKGMVGIAVAAVFAALALVPSRADAQIKPRILILFDTSGSMALIFIRAMISCRVLTKIEGGQTLTGEGNWARV